jgi:outer membrane protein assembly factor BamB
MSDESTNASRTPRPAAQSRRGPRHLWFPAAVVLAVGAWWLWLSRNADYQTLYHVIAMLAGAMAISIWFAEYGGLRGRIGWFIVGGGWLAVAVGWLIFQPKFNGDMGIVGFRLRFANEQCAAVPASKHIDDWQNTPRDYSRFLGSGYWPEVTGIELETDWVGHPPKEMWRREIGAGWSAFAIVGPYAITQEQRGDNEMVTCYRVSDGSLVWAHGDAVRFDPAGTGSLGREGPRATPTIVDDKVFTQGATGIVNCLDARSGDVQWSHDTAEETGAAVPLWGKSGSPLVVDDMVLVSVGAPLDGEAASTRPSSTKSATGANGNPAKKFNASLQAFDMETGAVRWASGKRQASYATPIVATLAGERQIICVNEHHLTAHRVKDGKVLWEYPWPGELDTTATASQPVPVGGDRLFVSKGYGVGASLLHIIRSAEGTWEVEPLWNPPVRPIMKTKFCNVVLRGGHVYGLDDVLLECIEWKTGRVKWKARRKPVFGHGQLLLVGDVLLVISEQGEVALVEASPERFHELARFQALDPSDVTWNTPAFAPPYLLIRNAREAACFRLPLKKQTKE